MAAALPSLAQAQATISGLPRVSPHANVQQTVGITEIEIDYHRPAVNGREVMGTLVPYDAVWRAGANDNTTISLSHDVKVEGQDLAAGTYGLHMIPTQGSWTVIFSHDSRAWGSFAYDESHDALRVEVEPRTADFEERLSYRFDDADNAGATVVLHWEKTEVAFRIEVDTRAHTLAEIEHQLTTLPRFSWQGWNSAAAYCVSINYSSDLCQSWSDRSIGMSRQFQNLMTKASLLRIAGQSQGAVRLEEEALPMGSEQEINTYGYQLLYQRNDVDGALEIFRKNNKDHPDSWNTYDSLGEALGVKGDTAAAKRAYQTALEKAPPAQHPRIQAILDAFDK